MLTTRLRNVYQQEQKQRKYVCVMNDVAKTKQDRYDHIIDSEKAEATQRSKKAIEMTRRNIVRQRVLKKFMHDTREEVEKRQASTLYGKYHGVSVDHIAGEVEEYLRNNHPRVRRAQKIKNLFQEGYEKGAILDKETVKTKVKRFFDKPLVKLHRIPEVDETSSKASPDLPSVRPSHFYTGDFNKVSKGTQNTLTLPNEKNLERINSISDNEGQKLFVRRKVSKFLAEDVPDDLSETSDDLDIHPNKGKDCIRPVTLPPIKIGTDSVESSKPVKGSIAELAAKFAKAKEKTEKLQRKLSQSQNTRKPMENATQKEGDDQPSNTRRPKSDRTGIKQVRRYKFKERKIEEKVVDKISSDREVNKGEDNGETLNSSLPPIKFKSSSKRFT